MVRLQTLDLRIGVRVPASQPNILQHFLKILQFPLNILSRLHCGLWRKRSIHRGYPRIKCLRRESDDLRLHRIPFHSLAPLSRAMIRHLEPC